MATNMVHFGNASRSIPSCILRAGAMLTVFFFLRNFWVSTRQGLAAPNENSQRLLEDGIFKNDNNPTRIIAHVQNLSINSKLISLMKSENQQGIPSTTRTSGTTVVTRTTATSTQKQSPRIEHPKSGEGFAACLWFKDDTMRLAEWLAYHYTVLPLSDLIIGMDRKNSLRSDERVEKMKTDWAPLGLKIHVWRNDSWVTSPKIRTGNHAEHQRNFILQCSKFHKKNTNNPWLISTDTDEYITFNYLTPDEEVPFKDKYFPNKKSPEQLEANRLAVRPIREKLPTDFPNTTILQYLSAYSKVGNEYRFLNNSTTLRPEMCYRMVGLKFGYDEASPEMVRSGVSQETLKLLENQPMVLNTLLLRRHTVYRSSRDTKALIKLRDAKMDDFVKKVVLNPHLSNRRLCFRTGTELTGTYYRAAIIRYHHYVGTLANYNESSGNDFRGSDVRRFHKRHKDHGPYVAAENATSGDDIVPWVDAFVRKVGSSRARALFRYLDLSYGSNASGLDRTPY